MGSVLRMITEVADYTLAGLEALEKERPALGGRAFDGANGGDAVPVRRRSGDAPNDTEQHR